VQSKEGQKSLQPRDGVHEKVSIGRTFKLDGGGTPLYRKKNIKKGKGDRLLLKWGGKQFPHFTGVIPLTYFRGRSPSDGEGSIPKTALSFRGIGCGD